MKKSINYNAIKLLTELHNKMLINSASELEVQAFDCIMEMLDENTKLNNRLNANCCNNDSGAGNNNAPAG